MASPLPPQAYGPEKQERREAEAEAAEKHKTTPTTTETSTIYEHPLNGTTLLPILRACLPASLPLYRRIQFPLRSEHSRLLATFPPPPPPPPPDADGKEEDAGPMPPPPPPCFLVAFVDRSRRPETELWLFSAAQLGVDHPSRCPASTSTTPQQPPTPTSLLNHVLTHRQNQNPTTSPPPDCPTCPTCTRNLKAILHHLALLPQPPSPAPPQTPSTSTNPYTTHLTTPSLAQRSILTLGTASATLVARLVVAALPDVIRTDLPGLDIPYVKFVFRGRDLPPLPGGTEGGVAGDGEEEEGRQIAGLLRGLEDLDDDKEEGGKGGRGKQPTYRIGPLRRTRDLHRVLARSAIPRRIETLRVLPSVAVFCRRGGAVGTGVVTASTRAEEGDEGGEDDEDEDGEVPIAWAFLGMDGSITSLHVEEPYRGRGLAKMVAARLLRDEAVRRSAGNDADAEDDYASADVAVGNVSSEGVCRSLGGVSADIVYWLRLDLDSLDRRCGS